MEDPHGRHRSASQQSKNEPARELTAGRQAGPGAAGNSRPVAMHHPRDSRGLFSWPFFPRLRRTAEVPVQGDFPTQVFPAGQAVCQQEPSRDVPEPHLLS